MPSKAEKMLTEAGFKVIKVYPGARWFEVVSPDRGRGIVLRQNFDCWHFFYVDFVSTGSGSTAKGCPYGGLGDAIGSETQMRTYKRLLDEPNVPEPLRKHPSVYVAMQQASHD